MPHRRIAGDGLDERSQRTRVAIEQAAFDPAVLVAELDLEMVDALAETHEAERAGLDDAGVDRPHGDLVNFLALDLVVGVRGHRRLVCAFEANRLEPRMTCDADAGLFVKLALEAVQGGNVARELVIAELLRDVGACHAQVPIGILQDRGDRHDIRAASPVHGDDPHARSCTREQVIAPGLCVERLDRCGREARGAHGARHDPPTEADACWMSELIADGM